jgi:hypothetical protein
MIRDVDSGYRIDLASRISDPGSEFFIQVTKQNDNRNYTKQKGSAQVPASFRRDAISSRIVLTILNETCQSRD